MAASLTADMQPADPRLMVVLNKTYNIIDAIENDQLQVWPHTVYSTMCCDFSLWVHVVLRPRYAKDTKLFCALA